jgi:hypothetical protein
MKAKLAERLDALKSEHDNGQKMLADIDAKRKNIKDTLLRIEGAMAILKELVEEEKEKPTNGAADRPAAEGAGSVAVS